MEVETSKSAPSEGEMRPQGFPVAADPPIPSDVSSAIVTSRVGPYPVFHPGLANTHMADAISRYTYGRDNGS